MLGLQNTRTGCDLPTRTYRCVACSATFAGLSSLLVHQASHANEGNPLNKLQPALSSPGISCTHCSIMFANEELMNQHLCGALPSSSPSFICECGEQFPHHDALLDHKRLHHHSSDVLAQDCFLEEENKCETSGTAPSSMPGFSSICGSDSDHTELQINPLVTGMAPAPKNERREDFSVPNPPLSHFTKTHLIPGKLMTAPVSQPVVFSALPAFTSPQDQPLVFGGKTMAPFQSSNVSTSDCILPLHKPQDLQKPKKTLKNMMFSELVKGLPPAQMYWNLTKWNTFSKNAVSSLAASPSGTSVRPLRKQLAKSVAKRKALSQSSAILNLITSSKPHTKTACDIVNLNRTFLPVVAVVTRQKLLGSGKDGMEGRHQCGRCRRIFQDVDSLILHHAVHRKERVNGCRCCGHLLIGKIAIPENHVCPQTYMLSPQDIFSVGILLSSPSRTQAYSSIPGSVVANPLRMTTPLPSTKKNYHCFLCNQSYTRLYRLKKHKCLGMTTILKAAASHKKDKVQSPTMGMRVEGELKTIEKQNDVAGDDLSLRHKSVGVGHTGLLGIKMEAFDVGSVMSPQCLEAERPYLGVRPNSTKVVMPFLRNSAKHSPSKTPPSQREGSCDFPTQVLPPVLHGNLEGDKREGKMACGVAERGKLKGQWTMPIDDSEIDQLIEAEGGDDENEEEVMESIIEKSIDYRHNQKSSQNQTFQGVSKCFICCHCGRRYARRFNMHQHQKKCPLGVRPVVQQNVRKTAKAHNSWMSKQSFDCLQCGRNFSDKDVLVLHQRNCQLRNNTGHGPGDLSGAKKRSSIPLQQDHLASQGRLFVLPPALKTKGNKKPDAGGDWGIMSLPSVLPRKVTCECGEGFTCPRLLFEHLQSHTQESYICPDCGESLTSWPVFEAHLRKHQRVACQKCNQTFSLRKSLQRHLKKNRCRSNTAAEKKHCCPRCKLELPSALGLKAHMQSPACKPPHKVIQCPVCMRVFGGVEGLQKHLMTHTDPNAFHCQLCQRSYPSLRSLKDHRRKVHKKIFSQGRVGGVQV